MMKILAFIGEGDATISHLGEPADPPQGEAAGQGGDLLIQRPPKFALNQRIAW